MSQSTLAVLRVLLDAEGQPTYGLEIGKSADIASGTLYPILDRLVREGWVRSHWEDTDPSREGRPRRRYYQLTGVGEVEAVRALQRAHARTTPRVWPVPATQGR